MKRLRFNEFQVRYNGKLVRSKKFDVVELNEVFEECKFEYVISINDGDENGN